VLQSRAFSLSELRSAMGFRLVGSVAAMQIHILTSVRPVLDLEALFIAGVPVSNHHLVSSRIRDEVLDWNVVVDVGTTDEEVHDLCQMCDCQAEGHPSSGGVNFFTVRTTRHCLEEMIHNSNGKVSLLEPDAETRAAADVEAVMDEKERSSVAADVEAVMDEKQRSPGWNLKLIQQPGTPMTGQGVNIFVLDTGIRRTHSLFRGRAFAARDDTSGKTCKPNSNTCARDNRGHGTFCAGIAAGTTHGVAPRATLRAMKCLDDEGSGKVSWAADALDFVAGQGHRRPAVASISIVVSGRNNVWATAVNAAARRGVVMVVAAGNENKDACNASPAFSNSVTTVGAVNSNRWKLWISNYGSCVDIWAPGASNIRSASHTGDWTTVTRGEGTSWACPHASGAAALLLQRKPHFNTWTVKNKLRNKAWKDGVKGTSFPNYLLSVQKIHY